MATPQATGLAHIAVWTADRRRSLSFYVDLLGFSLVYETTMGNMQYSLVKAGGCVVELLHVPGRTVGAPAPQAALEHFAIEVRGIEELVGRLRGAGYNPGDVFTIADLLGGVKGSFLDGPNGERIELFQYAARPAFLS